MLKRITENNKRREPQTIFWGFWATLKAMFCSELQMEPVNFCLVETIVTELKDFCLVWAAMESENFLSCLWQRVSQKDFRLVIPFVALKHPWMKSHQIFLKMIDDNPIYVHGFVGSWFKGINERISVYFMHLRNMLLLFLKWCAQILSLECNNILNVMVGGWQYNSVCLRDKGVTI